MADTGMKKTLGLTGVTVNAMALIAPGAFLWITFQIQAANNGGATDMWTGIVAALIVAFLTANVILRNGPALSGSRCGRLILFRRKGIP